MTSGPKPIGTWSGHGAPNSGTVRDFLHAGKLYTVIKEFEDYDHHVHAIGEKWYFLGCSFLPYDDGMSFFVSFDGKQEWHIRLQWSAEEQAHVLDDLSKYLGAL